MGEVVVIVVNPFIDGDFKVKRVIPVVAPDDVFFDGAHDPFGIGVTGLPRFALRNRISDFKGKVPEISSREISRDNFAILIGVSAFVLLQTSGTKAERKQI